MGSDNSKFCCHMNLDSCWALGLIFRIFSTCLKTLVLKEKTESFGCVSGAFLSSRTKQGDIGRSSQYFLLLGIKYIWSAHGSGIAMILTEGRVCVCSICMAGLGLGLGWEIICVFIMQ